MNENVKCKHCGLVFDEKALVQDYPSFQFWKCPRCKVQFIKEKKGEKDEGLRH